MDQSQQQQQHTQIDVNDFEAASNKEQRGICLASLKIPEGLPRWLHLQGNGSCRTQREIIQEPCKKRFVQNNHDDVVFQFDQTNIYTFCCLVSTVTVSYSPADAIQLSN